MKINIKPVMNLAANAAFLLLIALTGCTEPDELGMDVQPPGDKLNVLYTDTLSLFAYTKAEDSVVTDEILYNLLGNYNDPVFGKLSSSFYTQIRLPGSIDFGTNAVCDSIILSLTYKGYYGDSASPITVKVHELYESIYLASTYYSNSYVQYNGLNIAQNISYIPNLTDSVTINGAKYSPHLRVKLNNSFGDKIINAGTANLQNNSSFTQFIKGLYVTSVQNTTGGGICYFDLTSSSSGVTIYYHNSSNDSLNVKLIIDDNCARFSTFNHYNFQNASSPLKQQITGNIASGDSILYVQAMGGTRIRIRIPYLKNFVTMNNIAINDALLVLTVDGNDISAGSFPPPGKLQIARELSDGTNAFLPDYSEGSSFYGGSYNSNTKEYRFRISNYLQGLINNIYPDDTYINIMISGSSISANRVVFKGPGRTTNRARLILTYTKIQ